MPSIVDLGLGKVGNNSHPIHPITVHLPIAFLLSSSVLEILTYTNLHYPSLLSPLFSLFTTTSTSTSAVQLTYHLAHYSQTLSIIGLITALPALTSGLIEGYAMISSQGLDLENEKVRTTVLHAGLNDLAIVGAAVNVYSKWGKEVGLVEGWNVGVSLGVIGAMGFAAYLGGKLVYELGVGVQRMGTGKEKKDEGIEKEKSEIRKQL